MSKNDKSCFIWIIWLKRVLVKWKYGTLCLSYSSFKWSIMKAGKHVPYQQACANLLSKYAYFHNEFFPSFNFKIRQITWPCLAIKKKLAASSIICVWTYKKGPQVIRLKYLRQTLQIFVKSSQTIPVFDHLWVIVK